MFLASFFMFLFFSAALAAQDFSSLPKESKNWVKGPDRNWFIHYESAREKAKKEEKYLFVLNTGSDWCPYCVRLRNDVLTKSKFKRLASKKFVPVFLDSPRKKTLPKDQIEHNQTIRGLLNFGGGVPSVKIYDTDNNLLGEIRGYLQEKAYIEKIEEILKKDEIAKRASQKSKQNQKSKEKDDIDEPDDDTPAPSVKPAAKPDESAAKPDEEQDKFTFRDLKLGLTKNSITMSGSTPLVLACGDKLFFRLEYSLPEKVTAKIRFSPENKKGFSLSSYTDSNVLTGSISRSKPGNCSRFHLLVNSSLDGKELPPIEKYYSVQLKWE